MVNQELLGVSFGVGAAVAWAISSIFWARIQLSAVSINLHKNLLGTLILSVHLVASAWFFDVPVFQGDARAWLILAASGGIGIVLGDTCFFKSMQILGPGRALMITILAPFFTAIIGWVIGIEKLSLLSYLGIGLTMGGIAVVLMDKQSDDKFVPLSSGSMTFGVIAGVIGALCQASGGILTKLGAEDISGLEASFIRILCSGLLMMLLVRGQGNFRSTILQLKDFNLLPNLFLATAIGTWIGIWFSLMAFKYCQPSIAQTTMALCPLFAIPVAYFAYGQKASWTAIAGVFVSVAGVYLTVSGTAGAN